MDSFMALEKIRVSVPAAIGTNQVTLTGIIDEGGHRYLDEHLDWKSLGWTRVYGGGETAAARARTAATRIIATDPETGVREDYRFSPADKVRMESVLQLVTALRDIPSTIRLAIPQDFDSFLDLPEFMSVVLKPLFLAEGVTDDVLESMQRACFAFRDDYDGVIKACGGNISAAIR